MNLRNTIYVSKQKEGGLTKINGHNNFRNLNEGLNYFFSTFVIL